MESSNGQAMLRLAAGPLLAGTVTCHRLQSSAQVAKLAGNVTIVLSGMIIFLPLTVTVPPTSTFFCEMAPVATHSEYAGSFSVISWIKPISANIWGSIMGAVVKVFGTKAAWALTKDPSNIGTSRTGNSKSLEMAPKRGRL
ncbi:hypothetical protein BDZ88DRAFT_416855 [Geranomyces variabilis]|nr:hypothetical protein BDZ88DRAFT_416855 [Geranomyces variabilis]